jgi:hypothetical protein
MNELVQDLRSRRVVRVALGYVVTAFALLLPMGIATPWLGLPEWTVQMLAGIAFFTLPFVLVLIWALDDVGPQDPRMMRRR